MSVWQSADETHIRKLIENTKIVDSGCWEWQGAITSGGYGVMRFQGEVNYLHRVSFALTHDMDHPDELDSDINHKCGNKRCWNPAHLKTVTQRENMIDTIRLSEIETKLDADDVLDI